jgi:hypothetical protein
MEAECPLPAQHNALAIRLEARCTDATPPYSSVLGIVVHIM